MTLDEVKGLFTLAGIRVLKLKPLIDGYGYPPDHERFFQTPPRRVWWFVKTEFGWIEIGWRKRVISINWEETPVRQIVTGDATMKDETSVHAWGFDAAIRYLRALNQLATQQQAGEVVGQ